MLKKLKMAFRTGLLLILCWGIQGPLLGQINIPVTLMEKIDREVTGLMAAGDIPGISVVMINKGEQVIKNYGYANRAHRNPVTALTLFELGSCSKAFTALTVETLIQQGKLKHNSFVQDYIPWLRVYYKGRQQPVTILQLLHHTSGIPWYTISGIPQTSAADALEKTVRTLEGLELNNIPGRKYEYATINYDVLALIVEKVTRLPFEVYIQDSVINRLQLRYTTIGKPVDSSLMATGYRIGFLKPREYAGPPFRGNYAAGYIISNATDMARWLKVQMGLPDSSFYSLVEYTHQRDETVPLHGMLSYAEGWEISLNGSGEIFHGGLNPGFTSYVAFRPALKTGVVILANSNSSYTETIGNKVLKLLAGEEIEREPDPGDRNDKSYSLLSIVVMIYCLVVMAFLVWIMIDLVKGKRKHEPFTVGRLGKAGRALLCIFPFLYGLYLFPRAMADFTWEAILIWTPVSFSVLVVCIVIALALSYLAYVVSLCFPEKNKYKRIAPSILLMSILSGLSNVVIIIMVTSSIETTKKTGYLAFYYTLALAVYLLGRRYVQINLIRFTRGLIYDLTSQLVDKMFSTSYQNFEKIERGRVYTALNDDINTIGHSTNMIITLVTSVITAAGAFIYLASIAFWAALLTIFLILGLSGIYYLVSTRTNIYYKKARRSREVFMSLVNGLINGFKEISLHRNKKIEYKADMIDSAGEFRDKISTADTRFVNAFLIGESLLVILLGMVAFGMHELFPGIRYYTIMSFVIVLLYLIGPVNGILGAMPALMQLKIAWNRLQTFIGEIPATLNLAQLPEPRVNTVESIAAKGIKFQYKGEDSKAHFAVGPIDIEAKKGEIIFIIGGNGSGKTTLAKLLTGLYEPDEGQLLINNKPVSGPQLSEYFSTVFSPAYLFKKLYNIDVKTRAAEVDRYLRLLHLEKKVEISENRYSTIDLSGGQRKRLALLQCYLEDSPVYLFDEWAADQDPGYRHFFYNTLLPEMKKSGKIVIAITHDDHFFHVADRVLKMDQGQLETYSGELLLQSSL